MGRCCLQFLLVWRGLIRQGCWTNYRKVEHPFDGQWVAQHEECDAWLVLTSDTKASTVLAYYEREKPIYTNHPESGEANPFPVLFDREV